MSRMEDDAMPPAEEMDEINCLLQVGARMLCKSSDASAFLDWIADTGPLIAPNFAKRIDPRTGPIGNAFRALGVPLYNAMPLPDAGFRPQPLPKPGRNDPCHCGSGRKFKQCCQPLSDAMDFSQFNLLRYVLQTLPKKRYAELPDSKVDPHAVAHVAMEWNEEGDPQQAVALLEPWFADGRRLHAKLETLFDQLMDSYLRLGRERKREGLLAKMLASGDRTLRAAALQRRATMLSDKGRYDEAWAVFHEAQREAPDDPGIGLLEVTLLVSRGDTAQARERARFWALRMERMRDPDMQPMIQFLREVAADPAAAFSAVSRERNPDLGRLAELFANAPVPAAHHQLEQHDGMAVLSTDAAITAVESRWREVYPQEKPHLTFMQLDTGEMWECAPDWLDFLERTPLAWHSFDVLDDLVLAIDVVQELGMDLSLLEPLLARASALLEAHVPQGTLPWLAAQNRPALRLLARQAYRAMDVAQRDPSKRGRFVELAERLIQLNPNDNHGFRGPLSHAYLELGEPEKMLALYSHYPGDHICEMALNRVLALYELGRRGEALSALAELPRQRDAAVKMLLAANPKPPREDASGTVLYGGKPEAWAYRETHLALWQRSGALAWLRDAQRALRRKNS